MTATRIGQSIPQVTAREKVLGRALYAADIQMVGMLHVKVLRSHYPHARIVTIDCEAARALPGVHLVLTGADTPEKLSGVKKKEHRILATGKVRHVGEEVAVVLAEDEETARDALELIAVEYEELPPLFDPEEALGSDISVHEGRRKNGNNNVAHEFIVERGDVDAAFARAAAVHEEEFETHPQYPGYMEPMATVAQMGGDGRLTVWTSTQSPFLARGRLSEALEMPASDIRVIQATTGGGFGAKIVEETNSLIAAWVATKTTRPVRFVNSRLDDFQAARMSLPERISLKMAVDAEGRIIAKEARLIGDCGAYMGLCESVMEVSFMRSDNMHRVKNVRTQAHLVYTNNPPRGAFRGFGGPQMTFAVSSVMAVLAEKIGIDPLEMHRLNATRAGDVTVHGWKIGSAGLVECLDMVGEGIGWAEKRDRPRGRGVKRRGIGFGAAIHVSGNRTIGNWDGSTVTVTLNGDGRAQILTGEADMGQGAYTMLAQIVAHELDLPIDHVRVLPPDTDAAAFAIGALASRITVVAGNAARKAGGAARARLLALAAEHFGVEASTLSLREGRVVSRAEGSNLSITYGELARMHIFRHGGSGLRVSETWDAETQMFDENYYGNVAPAYSFAAQAVEVEVDTETGQVRIVDTWIADDCGRALNPVAVHGQSVGAATQAIGWTLYECPIIEDGVLQNGNFADYTMPTADSLPDIRSGVVESNDPNGPYGAKGASETAMVPGAGAIANAIADAVGVRITTLPITPEKVLAALREKARKEGMADA